jgi:hypothetical protein
MTQNLTLLLLPVVDAAPLEGRFARLPTLLTGGRYDPGTGQFDVASGAELSVKMVVLQPQPPRREVAVHRLTVLAWPAPDDDLGPFTTCFRQDPDRPDAAILTGGRVRFAPGLVELPPPAGETPPPPGYPAGGGSVQGFHMVFPARLHLVRPGRFSVLLSLTLRLSRGAQTELRTFRTDPEMNVEGSYPPGPDRGSDAAS